jgi:hypothetical protein
MTLRRPKITWGTSFANTLDIAYPLDNFKAYSTYREGSQFAQTMAGVEDAWIIGTDYTLEGDVRWIRTTNTTTPLATGWDGSTGVRAFLEWAREKNQFRFYPDTTVNTYILSYLVEPLDGSHSLESDGTRTIRLVMRNASTAYEGY